MRSILCVLAAALVAAADEPPLEGLPVSRPLQPVTMPEPPPAPPPVVETGEKPDVPEQMAVTVESGSPRKSWSSYDLLIWWTKAQPVPNLVTASSNLTPILNDPNTQVLVGGHSLGQSPTTGFRFNMGYAGFCGSMGLDFSGLFLGTSVRSVNVADTVGGRFNSIGRPFVNASNGQPSALVVAGATVGPGSIEVATTTRVQGWDVNGAFDISGSDEVHVLAIAGYRYLGVNEGLHIQQQSLRFNPNALWGIYDQFDARNSFHGGQIGLRFAMENGSWLISFSGSVAFGTNFESVVVSGGSSMTTAALPTPTVQRFNSGFLAVSSNSGRSLDSHFAVMPEARLKLGYRCGDNCFFFAGYDFLYLSDAVRPGDQVDLTVDPARSPILSNGQTPTTFRPQQPFNRTDFWAQGIVLGFDYRY